MEEPVTNDDYGTVAFSDGKWHFATTPVVARRLLRLFTSAREHNKTGATRLITLPHNADNAEDVEWVLQRYPHRMTRDQAMLLKRITRSHREANVAAKAILQRVEFPQPVGIETPLRHYQLQAVEMAMLKRGLLIGDDMGLGKTATAIGIIAAQDARPALVVCAPHVQQQWVDQVAKFAPGLRCHIVRTRKEYVMPRHDVAIITYSKLDAWAGKYPWKAVIYDEVQELRRGLDTAKGRAARTLGETCDFRIGLSATPIYNYANEAFHVFDFLAPGHLGTYNEFVKEWGDGGPNGKVRDAEALGAWLRSEQIYLRRTRRDVGRELPETNRVTQIIDFRRDAFDRLKGPAVKLARSVLEGAFTERGMAARQLDIMLRQATGIGKAPFVADFVADLVANGERVLLGGWHREVYTVWQDELQRREIPFSLYTGTESAAEKIAAAQAFTKGDAKVMIMSLRSGAGLDGLQEVCNTVVFGELDWSPKVHEQFTGRLRRDGQASQVNAFYLLADDGSDPIVANVLGIKDRQSTAVTDPDLLAKLMSITTDDALDDATLAKRGSFMAKQLLEQDWTKK